MSPCLTTSLITRIITTLSEVAIPQARISTRYTGVHSACRLGARLTDSGEEKEYQSLAYSGRPIWVEWNETIASADPSSLPPGITNETKIFEPSGFLRLANGPVLSEYDQECLKSLEAAGLRDHEHVLVGV